MIESDIEFLYAINRSRVSRAQSVKVLKTLNTSCLLFLSVRRCLTSEWRRLKGRREDSLISRKQIMHNLYKHLRAHLMDLDMHGATKVTMWNHNISIVGLKSHFEIVLDCVLWG